MRRKAIEEPPGPRKRFFPFINQRYCILEPLKKSRMMIGLANDVLTILSKDWVEVEEDGSAHVVLVAKVDEDQVLAKYVGDGGLWINHRPIKKNIIYALHEGDVIQLRPDGPLYSVSFVEPTELVTTVDVSEQLTTDKSLGDTAAKIVRELGKRKQ